MAERVFGILLLRDQALALERVQAGFHLRIRGLDREGIAEQRRALDLQRAVDRALDALPPASLIGGFPNYDQRIARHGQHVTAAGGDRPQHGAEVAIDDRTQFLRALRPLAAQAVGEVGKSRNVGKENCAGETVDPRTQTFAPGLLHRPQH